MLVMVKLSEKNYLIVSGPSELPVGQKVSANSPRAAAREAAKFMDDTGDNKKEASDNKKKIVIAKGADGSGANMEYLAGKWTEEKPVNEPEWLPDESTHIHIVPI